MTMHGVFFETVHGQPPMITILLNETNGDYQPNRGTVVARSVDPGACYGIGS